MVTTPKWFSYIIYVINSYVENFEKECEEALSYIDEKKGVPFARSFKILCQLKFYNRIMPSSRPSKQTANCESVCPQFAIGIVHAFLLVLLQTVVQVAHETLRLCCQELGMGE
ncbi:hypothetical protein C7N83_06305 [Neisseria iguanae]|uniref:Uncharacterized protein n=1 Tax=Neisseria iguanae TaxID=90242 RepID=A0A2P7U0N2_9NEIS|nr:hypothetical protein C7N83_06305 [Neisseria iguanae]